jgi:hypothetical protein
MSTTVAPSKPSSSASVIAELAREAQLYQLQSIDSLDTKAATLIGFAGVVLGLFFTSPIAENHWSIVLDLGTALVLLSIFAFALALLPRDYKVNPNILPLAAGYLDKPEDDTNRAVVDSISRALVHNADSVKWKGSAFALGNGFCCCGHPADGCKPDVQ